MTTERSVAFGRTLRASQHERISLPGCYKDPVGFQVHQFMLCHSTDAVTVHLYDRKNFSNISHLAPQVAQDILSAPSNMKLRVPGMRFRLSWVFVKPSGEVLNIITATLVLICKTTAK